MFPHIYAYYERESPKRRTQEEEDHALTVKEEAKAAMVKSSFRQEEGVSDSPLVLLPGRSSLSSHPHEEEMQGTVRSRGSSGRKVGAAP